MNTKVNHCGKQKIRIKDLALWTIVWTISIAIVTFGSEFLWDSNAVTMVSILICTLLGIGMIRSNIRYLFSLDELQRKIQMDAMGIALGVALVGGISYSLLDTTNLIAQDAEISYLIILIGLTYLAATLIGNARYK